MCPSCQNLFTERNTVKDIRTDREVEELVIKCSNRKDGCKWAGKLKLLDNHKESCNSESVPYTNSCGNAIQRQKLTDHLQKKCPKRNYQCPHCKREGEYRDITGPHLRVCDEMKIHCSNCQKNVKRCMMDAHQISCMAEPVPCQYQSVGCNARPSRQNISQHNLEAMGDHLRLAVEAIAQQHTEIVQLRRGHILDRSNGASYTENAEYVQTQQIEDHTEKNLAQCHFLHQYNNGIHCSSTSHFRS